MEKENNKEEISKHLDVAIESELEPGEEVLWKAQPDTTSMPFQLLRIPLLWLIGLFIYSIGTITDPGSYETNDYFQAVVFVFILIAIMGIAEIIAIPIQARKSIYVVTNMRTICIKLRGRFGNSQDNDYPGVNRRVIRPEKSTLFLYWAYVVPFQLIFIYLIADVVIKIFEDFNYLCLLGFFFLLLGWLYQWYQDLRIPLPQFRDCPKMLAYINEWLASIESVPHRDLNKVILHGGKKSRGDIFLLSGEKGCMRIKSAPEAKAVFDILKEQQKTAKSDSESKS